MNEKTAKVAALLEKLADKYDGEAVGLAIAEVLERADKAIEDGRVTLIEAMRIGMGVLAVLQAARKAG